MNSSRSEGCTLTGALSVTTAITDGITLIHGPEGCAHHNSSLLHALLIDSGRLFAPAILSTSLTETEVIFGGEEALEKTISRAATSEPGVICVLTSCVSAAIGDDVRAVCKDFSYLPVVVVPTGGFLGGGFSQGVEEALIALSDFGEIGDESGSVTLIGEKNLEYEVEANYQEVSRLLSLLGVSIELRFVRNISIMEMKKLGSSSVNILRDPSLIRVGNFLESQFDIPFIPSFPVGLEETLGFLETIGSILGIDTRSAAAVERENQRRLIGSFHNLRGKVLSSGSNGTPDQPLFKEIQQIFDISFEDHGKPVPIPDPLPVGTSGLSRMLHRWRRMCRE
jgi:nitrogenase molybdenum-iron protein alpha/beta subunit